MNKNYVNSLYYGFFFIMVSVSIMKYNEIQKASSEYEHFYLIDFR